MTQWDLPRMEQTYVAGLTNNAKFANHKNTRAISGDIRILNIMHTRI